MESFGAFSTLLLIINIFAIGLFVSLKVKRIRRYLDTFHENKVITTADYELLSERYTGLFWLFESFPDEWEYPKMYEDGKFTKFRDNYRRTAKYLLVSATVLLLIVMIFSPKEYHYP